MSLVAWYPLNGNTNDYSGNGYHLTGTPTYTNNGKIGQAADINRDWGSSTGFTDSICAGDFSVAFWIKIPYSATYTVSQPIGTNTSRSMNLFVYPSLYDFHGSQTGGGWIDYGFFTTDTWIHVTVVFNKKNGIAYRYKNGTLFASSASTTNPVGNTFQIGNPTSYSSDVELNDIRFYDHALSEKEIKEIAKAKILHYSFDDFQEPTQNAWNALSTTGSNGSWSVIDNTFINQPFISESKIIKCTPRSYMNYYTWNNTDGTKYPSGTTYTVSCWCYVDPVQDNMGSYRICGEGKTNASVSYDKTKAGTWQFLKFTVTSTDVGFYFLLYANEGLGEKTWTTGNVYYANVQVEAKTYNTPYTNAARSGTINDQSGFRNNATLALATTPQWVTDSKIGSGAYKFNGVNDYLNIISPFQSTQQIYTTTISFWIKLSSETTNYAPIFFNGTSGIWLSMKCEGSALWGYFKRFGGGTNYFRYGSSSNILYDTWYHVVFSFNNGIHKWYLNGSNVATLDTSATDQYLITGASSLMMGTPTNGWNGKFKGNVSDFKWFATELSDTDILELYQTRASIDNTGNIYSPQFVENIEPTINYSTNSNIETGTTIGYSQPGSGSTGTTIAIDSSVKYSGNYSLKLSRTGDTSQSNTSHYYGVQQSNTFGSVSGKTLTFSAKAKANRSGINFRIQMQRAGGNWQGFASSLYTSTGDWQTIYVTGTFDTSDSLTCYSRIYFNDHTTSGNGDSIYIDEWQMENKNYFTPFIIGTRSQSESLPSTFIYKEAIQENGMVQADSISEVGITEGLTLYYPFDKDSNDYSGNNYHGTSYNVSLSSGIKGQAYNFNGTTGYVASTFTFPNSYSIGCWFKHNGWGFNYENHLVASNTDWGTGGYRLYYGTTGVYFAIYDQQTTFYTGNHLDGNWHHLLVTFSQGTFNLFFDGILVNTKPSITRVISTSAMSIGRLYVTSSDIRYHKGSIDEVRIYNRALSAEEVAILYETTSPTSSSVKITKDIIYTKNEIKEVF